jgi:hypothetical protein
MLLRMRFLPVVCLTLVVSLLGCNVASLDRTPPPTQSDAGPPLCCVVDGVAACSSDSIGVLWYPPNADGMWSGDCPSGTACTVFLLSDAGEPNSRGATGTCP